MQETSQIAGKGGMRFFNVLTEVLATIKRAILNHQEFRSVPSVCLTPIRRKVQKRCPLA